MQGKINGLMPSERVSVAGKSYATASCSTLAARTSGGCAITCVRFRIDGLGSSGLRNETTLTMGRMTLCGGCSAYDGFKAVASRQTDKQDEFNAV